MFQQNFDYKYRYKQSNIQYQKQQDLNLLLQEHSNLQDQLSVRQLQINLLKEKYQKQYNAHYQTKIESQAISKNKQQEIDTFQSKIRYNDNSEQMDLSFDVDNDHIEVLDVQKLHQLINKNTEQQYVTLSRIPSLLDQQNNISPVQLPPLHPQQIRVNNSVEHMVGNFSERLSSQVSYNSTELTEPLVNNVSIFNIGQSEKESTRNFDEPNNSSNKAEPPQSTQKIDTLDMADINVDFYFDEL